MSQEAMETAIAVHKADRIKNHQGDGGPYGGATGWTLTRETMETAIAAHRADGIKDYEGKGAPYRTKLWTFTQHIKSGCPSDSTSCETFQLVNQLIGEYGGWEEIVPDLFVGEIYIEFISNWRDIKYRTDETILGKAHHAAQLRPLSHEFYAENPYLRDYAKFISLAGWLQVLVGYSPIMLPVERVGEILAVCSRTITRYRQLAVREHKFLFVDKPHVPSILATKFRFAVDQFPELEDEDVLDLLEQSSSLYSDILAN